MQGAKFNADFHRGNNPVFNPESIQTFKPQKIDKPANPYQLAPYQAKDRSGEALPQYDAMRTRLNAQYGQAHNKAQDSLDRQFAAAGGGPGNGAQAKQTENLANSIQEQKSRDLEGINLAEAQARYQMQEQEGERAFHSGESDLARRFQAGQNAAQMGMQSDIFNAQSGNQIGMFNAESINKGNQFRFEADSKLAALELAHMEHAQKDEGLGLARQELAQKERQQAMDQYISDFNMSLERKKNGEGQHAMSTIMEDTIRRRLKAGVR
jgi:hypothetical protein